MDPLPPFWLTLAERVVAFVMLLTILPILLLLMIFIRTNSNVPAIVEDEMFVANGRFARSYRFRTTGPGTPAFHLVGRFLRSRSFDDFPGLWSVVCGDIRLKDLFSSLSK